jgi:Lon-like protease
VPRVPGLRRPRWPLAVAGVFAAILAAFTYGWERQSGYYAIWPDEAHSAAAYLEVPGGHPPAANSGFYFVDVHVLQTNLVEEEYFRHFVSGADLIPSTQEVPPGESETQRVQQDYTAMADSQQVAQAVAERALGMHVGFDSRGVVVMDVAPHDPAAGAGVQPGSTLVAINGRRVRDVHQLEAASRAIMPGQVARYTFAPGGTKRIRTVAAPSSRGKHAIIGIGIGEQVQITHLPVHVRFLIHDIGGPSAGLAFALEIYDSLSGRHLLRGHRIAVTGQLDLDGSVQPIGGATQKTLGAIQAGADTFVVPAGSNYRDAVAAAHGRLRVIPVKSFAQALQAIKALPPV